MTITKGLAGFGPFDAKRCEGVRLKQAYRFLAFHASGKFPHEWGWFDPATELDLGRSLRPGEMPEYRRIKATRRDEANRLQHCVCTRRELRFLEEQGLMGDGFRVTAKARLMIGAYMEWEHALDNLPYQLHVQIEGMESQLRSCLADYASPNFTDRHGTADAIRVALGQKLRED